MREAPRIIKLFGRVQDNDPAQAKGAESPVAVIQIISKAEFQRMLIAREGIEALLSKYDEVRRRLEAVAEELEEMKKALEKAAPDSEMTEAQRKKLAQLARRLREEAQALRKIAQEQQLPIDIDRALQPLLDQQASKIAAAAQSVGELAAGKAGLARSVLARLAEISKALKGTALKLYLMASTVKWKCLTVNLKMVVINKVLVTKVNSNNHHHNKVALLIKHQRNKVDSSNNKRQRSRVVLLTKGSSNKPQVNSKQQRNKENKPSKIKCNKMVVFSKVVLVIKANNNNQHQVSKVDSLIRVSNSKTLK